jgi:hypothetical protein
MGLETDSREPGGGMTTVAAGQLSPSIELAMDWAWAAHGTERFRTPAAQLRATRTQKASRASGQRICWWERCWRIRTRTARPACCYTTSG